jgi:D-alanyl-D-alanine carboxypeptidase/D-alanyl-D-alanine-endopeptidase (penicillin-binding protein 4)
MRAYCASLLFAALSAAQEPAAVEAAGRRLCAQDCLRGARVGVYVADAQNGTALWQHDADYRFLPASNLKLVSGGVALLTLGADFTFTTRIETTAAIENGVLQGDLRLVGDGDPTFGGRGEHDPLDVLVRMIRPLRALGIAQITGRIIGDDDCQDDESLGLGWAQDDLSADFGAAFSGLNFAENVVRIHVRPVAPGEKCAYRVEPQVGAVMVLGNVTCRGPGTATELRVHLAHGTNLVRMDGTIAADAGELTRAVAVDNPTRYAAAALKAALEQAGVKVAGQALDGDDAGPVVGTPRVLARETSRSVREILGVALKDSVNLYAEQLYRTAARTVLQRSDGAAAAEHATNVLHSLGIDTSGLVLADGSGLSRRNLIRPDQLGRALAVMWSSPLREPFTSALPAPGEGTLKDRFAKGSAHGHLRAKTGSMANVACLAGYLDRAGRAPLVFAVLVNQYDGPEAPVLAAIDGFVDELATAAGWK